MIFEFRPSINVFHFTPFDPCFQSLRTRSAISTLIMQYVYLFRPTINHQLPTKNQLTTKNQKPTTKSMGYTQSLRYYALSGLVFEFRISNFVFRPSSNESRATNLDQRISNNDLRLSINESRPPIYAIGVLITHHGSLLTFYH